jgi:hypothetical protein
MSMGLWPVFDPAVDEVEPEMDGVALLEGLEILDALAEHLGVTPPSAFCDMREVPDDFDGDADELDELVGPWEDWFIIEDGLATFESLAEALQDPPDDTGIDDLETIVAELAEVARCLEAARRLPDVYFRLAFVE